MEAEYHIADLFQFSPFMHEEDVSRTLWVKRLYLIMLFELCESTNIAGSCTWYLKACLNFLTPSTGPRKDASSSQGFLKAEESGN